jgi:hypothetical protein
VLFDSEDLAGSSQPNCPDAKLVLHTYARFRHVVWQWEWRDECGKVFARAFSADDHYRILLSAVVADPELVVGFREQDGKIIGHAWVLVDDVSLVEPESDLVRFSPVLRFGARGVLLSQVGAGCEPKTLAR